MKLIIFIIITLVYGETNKFSDPYFYVTEGGSKCFVENTPLYLPITVYHRSYDNTGNECNLKILDHQNKEVLNKPLPKTDVSGRVTYLTQTAGQHQICIVCSKQNWFTQEMMKWTLSVDLGDADVLLEEGAKGFELISHELNIKKINRRLLYLLKEAQYNANAKADMGVMTRNLSKRVIALSLLQVLLYAGLTTFSVINMKALFRKQNLVT